MRSIYSEGFVVLFLLAAAGLGTAAVVINEVELNPPGDGEKWVELYNNGQENVSIGGWAVVIMEGPWQGTIPLPEGNVIASNGYYIATCVPTWTMDYNGTVILLDSSGAEVDRTHRLSDEDATSFTYSRYPNGVDTNRTGDFAFIMGSKGRSNGGEPRSG
ncbi:MAG: lamin tail domain-containing protein [Methanotrichaceae archaeon]|nr:lamin tail domain-containing protein [Methanotrichaceae archaeon]